MRLVEQAQQSKSATQVLADKAAGWLFYIALAVAAITAVAWTLATGFNVDVVARVATVLVIACPHALGLAIPLVVAITTAMGANNGMLVRDRLALEEARLVDTVIFDKTGTLTKGERGVVGMATVDGWDEGEALALAAAVEADSEHSIARGIVNSAAERGLALPAGVEGFEAIKGEGVRARVDGSEMYVGGPRLLESWGWRCRSGWTPSKPRAMPAATGTVGGDDGGQGHDGQQEVVAAFALADVIRPESFEAVQASCTRWAGGGHAHRRCRGGGGGRSRRSWASTPTLPACCPNTRTEGGRAAAAGQGRWRWSATG
jgi:P-type Cu2+ transporter